MAELDNETLSRLIHAAMESREKGPSIDYVEQADVLAGILNSFESPRDYAVGDIVIWKKCMKNRKLPKYGQPAIVQEILSDAVFDDSPVSSCYYREPLDVRLGFLDDDGDFVSYMFDGRRFRKIDIEER